MSFTLSTIPLCLLAVIIAYHAKWRLIPTMMFMSVFQAASILDFAGGAIGVGIGYVLLILAVIKNLLVPGTPVARRASGSQTASLILLLFLAYATVSSFLGPFIFQGVPYSNPKFGFGVPLHWETTHLNQLFYLLICSALFFVASHRTSIDELRQSLDWFVYGNVLAAAIGLYQLFCLETGLTFPSDLFHSNSAYATFSAYEINGFARINSTFVEASAFAVSLVSALAILMWRLLSKQTWKDALTAIIIALSLYLTVSSTGYICFFALFSASVLIYLFRSEGSPRFRAAKLIVGAAIALSALALVAIPRARERTSNLLDTVIFDKQQTSSFEVRTQANNDGLQTAAETLWLGAGWGVCRASSLLPSLLGNVGIPGTALFAAFAARAFFSIWRTTRQNLTLQGQAVFALGTLLIGLLVAGPEISFPYMWVFFAAASVKLVTFQPPTVGAAEDATEMLQTV